MRVAWWPTREWGHLLARGTGQACVRWCMRLRIPAKLAGREDDRFANGNRYSIDHGNRTLVRLREEEMHREMDTRGLRWRNDRKNEPFKPKRTVDELIACTRPYRVSDTVQGEGTAVQLEDEHGHGHGHQR